MSGKRLIRLLIILALFAVAAGIALRFITSPVVERIVRSTVEVQPLQGHTIDFEKLSVNPFTVSGTVSHFSIKPDSAFFGESLPDSLKYLPVIDFEVEKVSLKRLHILKLIFDKELIVNKIVVRKPHIHYILPHSRKPEEPEIIHQDSLKVNASDDVIHVFDIGRVEVREGNFSMARYGKEPMLQSRDYTVIVADIQINPEEAEGAALGLTSVPDVDISLQDNEFRLPGDLYRLTADGIIFGHNESKLTIEGLKFKPLYSKEEFGWENGYQTDRMDVSVNTLVCSEIDLDNLLASSRVTAGNVSIDGVELNIYRDKNVPFDYSRYPDLPHQAIAGMNLPIKVDSVSVSGFNLQYEEVAEGDQQPGIIALNDAEVLVRNVTNDPSAINAGESMVVNGTFMLQGEAEMMLTVIMPLNQAHGEFRYYGTIEPFDLPILNTMTENAIKIKTISGRTDRFDFDVYANQDYAEGTLNFYYHNLSVALLKEHKDETDLTARGFLSNLANIAMRSQNPHEGKPGHIALLYWDRDKNKGIVNLMLKPLINGIIASIKPGKRDLVNEGDNLEEAREKQLKRIKRKKDKN
jgi:hypothetical protein